jgi:hypothetical protein
MPKETTIAEKVFNLYNELLEAKRNKKDVVKAHSENIKRIEAEIEEILDAETSELAAKHGITETAVDE